MKMYEIDGKSCTPSECLERLQEHLKGKESASTFFNLINEGKSVTIEGHTYRRCYRDYV